MGDDDDGAQALKALLLKDQKEGAVNSETFKEENNMEGKIEGAEKQKNEQGNIEDSETNMLDNNSAKMEEASNSDVIEVTKPTVTKVIIGAQQIVSETTSNKTTTKSETNGTSAEEEVHLDWKDDKDGAEGLKTLLKDGKEEGEKRENNIEVISVATATEVIEEAKKKVSETASLQQNTSLNEEKGGRE